MVVRKELLGRTHLYQNCNDSHNSVLKMLTEVLKLFYMYFYEQKNIYELFIKFN